MPRRADQWQTPPNREPHASLSALSTHFPSLPHLHPLPVCSVHSSSSLSAGMRASDSRITLHGRPAVQPAIDEPAQPAAALSISIPLQRAFILSFFPLQQACQSQELFFSYTLFCSSFLFPRAWCSLSIPSHSNNQSHSTASSVAGRHHHKNHKNQQHATNQLFFPTKFSINQ